MNHNIKSEVRYAWVFFFFTITDKFLLRWLFEGYGLSEYTPRKRGDDEAIFFVSLPRNCHWKWTQKYNQYSQCHCKRQIDKHFPWLIPLESAARGSAWVFENFDVISMVYKCSWWTIKKLYYYNKMKWKPHIIYLNVHAFYTKVLILLDRSSHESRAWETAHLPLP